VLKHKSKTLISLQRDTEYEKRLVDLGFVCAADDGLSKAPNPYLGENWAVDLHRLCPHDKFHTDEDSSGHAPHDCKLLASLLNARVYFPSLFSATLLHSHEKGLLQFEIGERDAECNSQKLPLATWDETPRLSSCSPTTFSRQHNRNPVCPSYSGSTTYSYVHAP
jgi:hypothetical protein